MSTPANLYPGLNDLVDVLEEVPIEITKYLTLLHEIDAKCIHILPQLNNSIDQLFDVARDRPTTVSLNNDINPLLEELMPSLEEKMHVSAILAEIVDKLNKRLELAYEVTIRNEEIPHIIRLGRDNHPAMHLHYELVHSILNPHQNKIKSTQSAKSESRREAMLAAKKNETITTPASASASTNDTTTNNTDGNKRTNTTTTQQSNNVVRKRRKKTTTTTTTTKVETTKAEPTTQTPRVNEYGEPVYCYCNQVAYGEMVGCDGENCELEWFHLPCIGLTTLPKGKWYCDTCKAKLHS